MDGIRIVSFDVEGTLVTPDFSYAVWYEAIPQLYAQTRGVSYGEAKQKIEEEYARVGDQRLEWYDVRYWIDYFGLGAPENVLSRCEAEVCYYPEVIDVLKQLSERYELVIASGSTREFLSHLLRDIKHYFARVFSSISDYHQLKTKAFYLEICRELGITPERVVHVGDNWQFDYDNPRQVGIRAFYLERERRGQLNNVESLKDLRQLQLCLY